MRTTTTLLLSALLAGGSFAAEAQSGKGGPNWRANPVYETVTLSAGFTPDPWSRQLQAGGPNSVSGLASGCVGYINNAAPDFDLNYTAGSLPLYIHASSDTDTTLVINDPSGRWHCNDDAIGLNPMVSMQNPQSGNYNIWVGVHGSTTLSPATLLITEIDPRGAQASGGGRSGTQPNWRATPTFTTVNLSAGFTPDPWSYRLQAGGSDRIDANLGSGCVGFIHAGAPDVDLNYTSGSLSLYIRSDSSTDTTLAVLDPDGNWHCNDDSIGLDPVVSFQRPRSGNYNIWIGVHGSATTADATLQITEINPR